MLDIPSIDTVESRLSNPLYSPVKLQSFTTFNIKQEDPEDAEETATSEGKLRMLWTNQNTVNTLDSVESHLSSSPNYLYTVVNKKDEEAESLVKGALSTSRKDQSQWARPMEDQLIAPYCT